VSLLASARTAGSPPPVGPATEILLPSWLVSAAIVGFALAICLPIIYYRLRTPGAGGLNTSLLVSSFSLLLALVIAVALLHIAGGGGGGLQSVGGGSSNSTHGSSPPGGSNNTTLVHGPGGVLAPFNIAFPPWALFAVVAVALVLVAVAALPPLADYVQDRREARWSRDRAAQVAASVRSALRRAGADLGTALDPRAIILALYATLLARIQPLASNLEQSTPEEIRRLHLTRLGIRAEAAEDLTRVFEEARYSSHPLGPEQVARAAAAIQAAEQDLKKVEHLP